MMATFLILHSLRQLRTVALPMMRNYANNVKQTGAKNERIIQKDLKTLLLASLAAAPLAKYSEVHIGALQQETQS